MNKSARAIIIEDNKLLLMRRDKEGQQYYTLVGGGIKENETTEDALKREVKEETGLDIIKAVLVYIEKNPEPFAEQHTFLCKIAPHGKVDIQTSSEEAILNKTGITSFTPMWVDISSFPNIAFKTIELQNAIIEGLTIGFPDTPIKL